MALISKAERTSLEAEVQYLNLAEMRAFCQTHTLALYIHAERSDGKVRKTGDRDRKDIVLQRILTYALQGKRTGPTTYITSVVADGPLPSPLTARTRIRYGQYEKKNPEFVSALRQLTDDAFELGMIARLVLRDFWTAGEAPTLRQFADAWLLAKAEHTVGPSAGPRPEGAYLVDLARGTAGPDWKAHRTRTARSALHRLEELIEDRGPSA